MNRLYEVRREFGDVYATVISDDLVVPWRPLSLGDFAQYELAQTRAVVLSEILEDEIFRKCVVDAILVKRINTLPAGVISSVVAGILQFSGPPPTAEVFNEDLQMARVVSSMGAMGIITDIINHITLAYQYTPTELLAMPYEELLKLSALAETKLMGLGVIKEPLFVNDIESEEGEKEEPQKLDAKQIWDQQQEQPPRRKAPRPKKKMDRGKWWKKSPILEAKKHKRINFDAEAQAFNETHLDTHDMNEHPIVQEAILKEKIGSDRDRMVADAYDIYADVIEALQQEGEEE